MDNFLKKRLIVTKAHADIAFSATVIVLSLYMLIFGNQKFIKVGFGAVGKIDDRLFPNILMVAALILGCAIFAFAMFDNAKNKRTIAVGGTPPTTEFSICALFIALIGVFFCLTMKTIGYPLSSCISIYAVYFMLGGRKIWKGVVLAGVFTLICYLFFAVYLGVNLPIGFGF